MRNTPRLIHTSLSTALLGLLLAAVIPQTGHAQSTVYTPALVDKLSACLELELELDALQRDALEFEERISALVSSDPELEEYVKQLKRREFAQ